MKLFKGLLLATGILLPNSLTADSLTLLGLGVTYHGLINKGAVKSMKNKIDKNGKFAKHLKEVGLLYRKEYLQVGGVYLKDCFDGHAGMLYGGPKVDVYGRYVSVGGIVGAYIRESVSGASLPLLMKPSKDIDLVPMAAVTASALVPVTAKVGLELNVMGNFFVNHATVGLRYDF